jgi:hypothetical protein
MTSSILRTKDFWAGLMLLGIGVAAIGIARGYPLGTALRMGPGYFPILLGGLLVLFGLAFVLRAWRSTDFVAPNWSARALIALPLAMIAFGLLLDRAGFVPALAALVFGSALAGNRFRFAEVATLTVLLTALCVVVFIWGLGLPYPLVAGW